VEENEKLALILEALDAKKAQDVVTLEVGRQTQMMDLLVICTGTSNIHIRSLADGVIESMKEHGYKGVRAEGYNEARWVLLDYGDVVLHIFAEDDREFYRLEEFWQGAPRLDLPADPDLAEEEPATVGAASQERSDDWDR
jgi:ribosome-associated protein